MTKVIVGAGRAEERAEWDHESLVEDGSVIPLLGLWSPYVTYSVAAIRDIIKVDLKERRLFSL